MVVRAISLDIRPIACSCKKSYDKVITQAILSHPRTTLSCSRAPAAYWRKTVRKILCVCFVHRSLSDASDRTCSVRPYFYLRLFLRVHSYQIEFCVSYDFLIASSRAPIVKAPLTTKPNDINNHTNILFFKLISCISRVTSNNSYTQDHAPRIHMLTPSISIVLEAYNGSFYIWNHNVKCKQFFKLFNGIGTTMENRKDTPEMITTFQENVTR